MKKIIAVGQQVKSGKTVATTTEKSLAKIEALTYHTAQQQNEIQRLDRKIQRLKRALNKIKTVKIYL